MCKWYEIPIDYNEEDYVQPKYYDGYGITYFGDRLFEGYSGIVQDNKYICKVRAPEEIHTELSKKEDVIVLSDAEVENRVSTYLGKNYSFSMLDKKFKC